ncbi:HNH endonuclease [Vibrio phage D148]
MRKWSRKKGIPISKEWDDFSNFHYYCMSNGWTEDLSICLGTLGRPGEGVYEPGNIYFVKPGTQTSIVHSMEWSFRSPDGSIHTFTNLSEFSRDNGLIPEAMRNIYIGKGSEHRGWSRAQSS